MRYADARPQRGAAVLIALVTVIVAVSIAASVIGSLGRSIDNASGRQDQAQARLLARGAADWARNVLADDAKRTRVDHLREPWTVQVPPTPVNSGPLDGDISGEINDWSGLFNVNNLAPNGKPDETSRDEFERLLRAIGVNAGKATQLAENLQAWIASEESENDGENSEKRRSGRSADASAPRSALADIDELRQLSGFDDMLISQLTPYAVAVPAPSKININTASAEVLSAVITDLSLDEARILVAERDRAWFKDIADFNARLPKNAVPGSSERLDVMSRFFLVTGRASHGKAMVRMEVLLDRKNIWPDILWQRIL